MEKEIGEWFIVKYFISIFIRQTISTYQNKLNNAWCYTSQFLYNRTLAIVLILDSCHTTWSTAYIPNEYSNYSSRAVIWQWTKTLFSSRNIGKQYKFYDSYHDH